MRIISKRQTFLCLSRHSNTVSAIRRFTYTPHSMTSKSVKTNNTKRTTGTCYEFFKQNE